MNYAALFNNINWLAVSLAAVTSMVWSFIWYSKGLTGNQWMQAVGVSEEELVKAYPTRVLPAAVILSFVSAFTLSLLLKNSTSWPDGLVTGAGIGTGIAASQVLILYAFALRPVRLMVIDSAWVIVNFALMGIVLSIV